MRKPIRSIFLLCCLIFAAPVLSAEREFRNEKLEKFRNDPDFSYLDKEVPDDFFLDYIGKFFNKLFGMLGSLEELGGQNILYFFYLLASGILVYGFLMLLKTNFRLLLVKDPAASPVRMGGTGEDIREVDLDTFLKQYIKEKNFRMATRYLFLMILKELHRKELISWSPEKTNRDYEMELSGTPAGSDFSRLSRIFSYTWYGNFPVSETDFNSYARSFEQFRNRIGKS